MDDGSAADQRRASRNSPDGATALYDAVAEALPLLRPGRHRKKALLLISDGNDTSSHIELADLKQRIHESEAIVYAIGMDAQTMTAPPGGASRVSLFQRGRPGRPGPHAVSDAGSDPSRRRIRRFPACRAGPSPAPRPPGTSPPPDSGSNRGVRRGDERVNVAALRDITDDSGGRTEILRDPRDLDPTTARIADELSKQYYIGYPSRVIVTAAGTRFGWRSPIRRCASAHAAVTLPLPEFLEGKR